MSKLHRCLPPLVTILCLLVLSPSSRAEIDQTAVDRAIALVGPALVRIHVVNDYTSDGRSLKSEASGSGVIVSPEGHIVTNHHVAGKAVRLLVTLANREELPARLVGTDAMSDIAVIQLEPPTPRAFPFARWGDSSALRVGQPVLAMGSPLALAQSVTNGIIANTSMTMPSTWGQFELDGENVGSIVRWIAHDATIFPGNSGGPLVDLAGTVIGINEIRMGLGGAIPGNLARAIADELIGEGSVRRAWVGMLFQPIFKGEGETARGVVVSDVIKGSPAAAAGLRAGDRLLALDEHEVDIHFVEELPPLNLLIAQLPIGRPVQVRLDRDGATTTTTITPERREPVLTREREFKQWGLTGRNLSFWTALELGRENTEGVLVTSLRSGGPAAQAKPDIQVGDIIVAVAGCPIRHMDELTTVTREVTDGQSAPVPVLVDYERKQERLMTVTRVGLLELNDPGRDVVRPWVPVSLQVLTRELANQLKLNGRTGVRVTRLFEPDSDASLGLRVGDIIVALDDQPIPASEPHDIEVFPTMIRQYRNNSEVELTVLREGEEIKLAGRLTARPRQPREMSQYQDHDFEFTVRNVAYLDRKTNPWEDAPEGVLIAAVQPGGWAALGRVQVGDLLLAIDGEPVKTVDQVESRLEQIKRDRPAHVIMTVRRGIHTLFVEIDPIWAGTETGAES